MRDETRLLKYCALFYALGLALHTSDHLRRGLDVVTPQVQWAGYVSTTIGLTAVALVLLGNRYGPFAAARRGHPGRLRRCRRAPASALERVRATRSRARTRPA